jgi:hypothetical protein
VNIRSAQKKSFDLGLFFRVPFNASPAVCESLFGKQTCSAMCEVESWVDQGHCTTFYRSPPTGVMMIHKKYLKEDAPPLTPQRGPTLWSALRELFKPWNTTALHSRHLQTLSVLRINSVETKHMFMSLQHNIIIWGELIMPFVNVVKLRLLGHGITSPSWKVTEHSFREKSATIT